MHQFDSLEELLELFRNMSDEDKDALLDYARELLGEQDTED